MNSMFSHAKAFNQDISLWDVSNVKNMSNMFDSAESFKQTVSPWDVSMVKEMKSMFDGVTLSTEIYDAVLQDWSKLPLKRDVEFIAGESKYCNSVEARQDIIDKYDWIIEDGGLDPDCL